MLPFWIKWKRILFGGFFEFFGEKFGLEHSRDWNLHFEKKRIRFRELLQTPKNTKIRHHKNSQNISDFFTSKSITVLSQFLVENSRFCQDLHFILLVIRRWTRKTFLKLEISRIFAKFSIKIRDYDWSNWMYCWV